MRSLFSSLPQPFKPRSKIGVALSDSIFEDPDFFERVVLGVPKAADDPATLRASLEQNSNTNKLNKRRSVQEIERQDLIARAAELELRDVQVRRDHQRLIRQASQIAQVLKRRREEVERRREAWERRDAELASRERASRIWIDQRVLELEEQQVELEAQAAQLHTRAAGLAAWELQLQAQAEQLAALDSQQKSQFFEQQSLLEQQRRQTLLRQSQVEHILSALTEETAFANQQAEEASRQAEDNRAAQASLQSDRELEIELRLEQLIRWERELSLLFAEDLSDDSNSDATTSAGNHAPLSQASGFSRDASSVQSAEHLATELLSEIAAVPDLVSIQTVGWSEGEAASPMGTAHQSVSSTERNQTIEARTQKYEQLLETWERLILAALEDRVVTQEVHRHLCEQCDASTLASIETPLRARVAQLVKAAVELVAEQRTELAEWLELRSERLRDWVQAEQQQWQERERRWRRLKSRWLAVDDADPSLQGPHSQRDGRHGAQALPSQATVASPAARSNS